MDTTPKVSIILPVRNGAAWLDLVLGALTKQTYPNIEVIVCDNASTDETPEIVRKYPNFQLNILSENLGPWATFERTLGRTTGTYAILLTDIVLEPEFITRAVTVMEKDPSIGAVQGKIMQMKLRHGGFERTDRIDTTGFAVYRSRKITNRGQGHVDTDQYAAEPIAAVEGAVPVFRRAALEASRISGWLIDPDYRIGSLGYGDDLDLAWRMNLLGWTQWYEPSAIGWHQRSTTTGTGRIPVIGQLGRRSERSAIPLIKRRLDWSNNIFTVIKNDYIINILRDLPWIILREFMVLGYMFLFEWGILRELPRIFRLIPTMLRRRKEILSRAVRTPSQMHAFFT